MNKSEVLRILGDTTLCTPLGQAAFSAIEAVKKLTEYEDLEEQCIKENSFGFKMLLEKWKEFQEDIQEFYEYRKLEEQNRLIKLPCAIEDMVYLKVELINSGLYTGKVVRIDPIGGFADITFDTGYTKVFSFEEFGKTVFIKK
jgi:hypothetical protein